MSLRGLVVLGLLIAATAAERFAYYGMRSFLAIDLRNYGANAASIGMIFAAMQLSLVAGTVSGGAIALALGPRVTAAAGAFLAVLGHFALAAGAPFLAGAGLVAFGAGVFWPCPVAAAAEACASEDAAQVTPNPLRFAVVTAFACALYGGVNIASMLAGAVSVGLRHAGGRTLSYAPYRRAPVPAAPAPAPPLSAGLLGLAILAGPTILFTIGESLAQPPMELLRDHESFMWLYAINPIVAILTSLALLAIAIAAVLNRWPLPPLTLYAVSLAIFGAGLVPIALAGGAGENASMLYVTGDLVTGIGEAAVNATAIAYVALAVRGRGATLTVGVWLAVMTGVSSIAAILTVVGARMPLTLVIALICLGCGGALLVLARRMHSAFFDPPPLVPDAEGASLLGA